MLHDVLLVLLGAVIGASAGYIASSLLANAASANRSAERRIEAMRVRAESRRRIRLVRDDGARAC